MISNKKKREIILEESKMSNKELLEATLSLGSGCFEYGSDEDIWEYGYYKEKLMERLVNWF